MHILERPFIKEADTSRTILRRSVRETMWIAKWNNVKSEPTYTAIHETI